MATESCVRGCFCRAVLSLRHCPLRLIYLFLSLHVPLLPLFLSLFSIKTFLCCYSGHWALVSAARNFLIHFYVAEKKTKKTTTRGKNNNKRNKKTLMQSKADGIDACLGNSSSVSFNVTNRIETTVDVVDC